MKKILLTAAILALAGCGEKKAAEAPAGETTTGEMAPAATPADTGMMSHDSGMGHSDSVMTRDSAK